MNTNPEAKRVLCYGDSITRGRIPSAKKRFLVGERWTGVLQMELGIEYEIIEEGLRGRTTHLYDKDLKGKNGLEYFLPCFYSHLPLDIVVIFLGTNNLQKQFNETGESIVPIFDDYIKIIKDAVIDYNMVMPKIILVSPPWIDGYLLKQDTIFDESSEQRSRELSSLYKTKAETLHLYFFDAAKVVGSGRGDGVHLDLEQNIILGKAIATYIQSL